MSFLLSVPRTKIITNPVVLVQRALEGTRVHADGPVHYFLLFGGQHSLVRRDTTAHLLYMKQNTRFTSDNITLTARAATQR